MAKENDLDQRPITSPEGKAIGEQGDRQQTGSHGDSQARRVEVRERQHQTKKSTPVGRVAGGEVLNDAKDRFKSFKQETDDYIRKNPTKAVVTALGIGFVLGLMRRRRTEMRGIKCRRDV